MCATGLLPCTTYRIMADGEQLTVTTEPTPLSPKKGDGRTSKTLSKRKAKKLEKNCCVSPSAERSVKLGAAANFMVRVEKGDDSLRIFATSGLTIFVEKKVKGGGKSDPCKLSWSSGEFVTDLFPYFLRSDQRFWGIFT